ncbi:Transglutaminase-like superfamily protein [Planctomycetes bacterium Pan216]|uniref:Transglutaminase-like superfamily protein n=1 Tax=Kolteria novifilia TaxID=2527975 RepID=A0A518BBN3_9BACT|nr:Transglutaminase-like superfamily protein [Planctomycetes bacterium Pan216]
MNSERLAGYSTIALAGIGSLAIQDAIAGPLGSLVDRTLFPSLFVVVSLVSFQWLSKRARPDRPYPRVMAGVSLGLLLAPAPVEWLTRSLADVGIPYELVMIAGLRNVTLGLAAASCWRRYRNIAAALSAFCLLFACTLDTTWLTLGCVAAYTVAGSLWLMVQYQSALRIESENQPTASMPIPAFGIVLLVLFAALGVVAGAGESVTYALGELMPTSGGTGARDPFARGGIGDGDDVVAGEDVQSDGGDSDIHLSSPEPSLYDVFNELYGEPQMPKNMQRAIALPSERIREPDKVSKNHQAGREFSLHRRRTQRRPAPRDLVADAQLYVDGKSPQHLPLVAYDEFDGWRWHEAEHAPRHVDLEKTLAGWLKSPEPEREYEGGTERYRIKVGKLETRGLPFPRRVVSFKLGAVDRADFFRMAYPGIISLADASSTLPPGTILHVEAATLDWEALEELSPHSLLRTSTGQAHADPSDGGLSKRTAELVDQWAAEYPPGPKQVAGVVERLRDRCRLDRDAIVPSSVDGPVDYFLFESRKGPDYLFATTATLALRHLGYTARAVSGFYVNPARYDAHGRTTPVVTEDAHFWTEVQLANGDWITQEPTPGYFRTPPTLTWEEWAWTVVAGAMRYLIDHAAAVAAILLAVGLVTLYRRRVADVGLVGVWWVGIRCQRRASVAWTLWLLERRATLAGHRRPPGQTPSRWLGPLTALASEPSDALSTFLQTFERVAYGAGVEDATSFRLCGQVVRDWKLATLRSALSEFITIVPER